MVVESMLKYCFVLILRHGLDRGSRVTLSVCLRGRMYFETLGSFAIRCMHTSA